MVGGTRLGSVTYSATTSTSYLSNFVATNHAGTTAVIGAWPGVVTAGLGLGSTVVSRVDSSFESSVFYSSTHVVGGFPGFGIGIPAFAGGVGLAFANLHAGLPGRLNPLLGGLNAAHLPLVNNVLGVTIPGSLGWDLLAAGFLPPLL